MQTIICEVCNGKEFVKDGDYLVCQSCGTKYTVEAAKKLMIDGAEEIDSTESVQKFLANARRAKQKEDWKEAEKYYSMAEQDDPTNIEAVFYGPFAQVKLALLEKDSREKRKSVFKILENAISVIGDNYNNADEEHQKLLFAIMDDIKGLKNGTIVPTTHLSDYVTKNGYGNIVGRNQIVENDSMSFTHDMIDKVFETYMDLLANIIAKYSPEAVKRLFWENADSLPIESEIHEKAAQLFSGYKTPRQLSIEVARQIRINQTTKFENVWSQKTTLTKAICPQFMDGSNVKFDFNGMVMDELRKMYPNHPALNPKSGCCYVATCVYGSYDCPQVWTLRRYRDNHLAQTRRGRAFIKTYYAISPTIVKWFGNTEWFKKMWKGTLDRMVKRLNEEGVENTPYEDREW